jgi:hypothetical protein
VVLGIERVFGVERPLIHWPALRPPFAGLIAPERAEETSIVASWLERTAPGATIVELEGVLPLPLASGIDQSRPRRIRIAKER